jgi:hypothetical protein
MSRSNPTVNAPNPAVRWFEWNGEHGKVRYYDKDAKKNIDVPLPFSFLLLDELASVRGWHDASESGIYSNEVRDTRTDILVVKSFKGGTLVEGVYKDIKDRANAVGGHFNANCYIAFKASTGLAIGCLRFKASALGAWMEFRKAHRSELYEKAVNITGFSEGKKGRIVFRVPTFELKDVSGETNAIALDLDKQFQDWLKGYLSRKTHDRAEQPSGDDGGSDDGYDEPDHDHSSSLTDSDIPFAWIVPFMVPAAAALLTARVLFA